MLGEAVEAEAGRRDRLLKSGEHVRIAYRLIESFIRRFDHDWLGPLDRKKAKEIETDLKRDWYAGRWPHPKSLYRSLEYLVATLPCYQDVTAPSCRQLVGWFQKIGYAPKIIMDAWGGSGLATAHLALALPKTTILYHNNRGNQYDTARKLFDELQLDNVGMTYDPTTWDCQVVVAFEAMEHFQTPVAELEKFIGRHTELYVDCSSFAYNGAGHFNTYFGPDGRAHDRKKFRAIFNNWIRLQGFADGHKKFGTKPFWQGRPMPFWRDR